MRTFLTIARYVHRYHASNTKGRKKQLVSRALQVQESDHLDTE